MRPILATLPWCLWRSPPSAPRPNPSNPSPRCSPASTPRPALACQLDVAAQLLALFLADKEPAIRHALAQNNLAAARRLVNGGTNGLDRFSACYSSGCTVFASATPPAQPGLLTQSP